MKIGFIGFGEVSCQLSRLLENEELITSDRNRSEKTVERIIDSNVEILKDFKEVARNSDILISANSPKTAIEVAKKYGNKTDGIYLDLNNINPDTAIKISKLTPNFIDSAIVGNVKDNPVLYISGNNCNCLEFLEEYINVKVISDKIGDASRLKMLRSIYTKALAATLIETTEIAEDLNLKEELLSTLAINECDNFIKKANSRINNTKSSSKRKQEELEEILEYFNEHDLTMSKATLKKLTDLCQI